MAQLLQTDKQGKGRGSHYHIVFVDDSGAGTTSEDRKHVHPIEGGQVVQGDSDHTHALSDIEVQLKPKGEDEGRTISDSIDLFKNARDEEQKSIDDGRESESFFMGDQWDGDTKADLRNKQRAALTINEIESKIDILSGHQRQNRTDIRYLPVEEGDQKVADILTILVKNILEQNNYDYEETEVFEDSAITGRGLFNIFIDNDRNIEGDIVINKYNWDEVLFGPHDRKDLADCDYLTKIKWVSLAQAKILYPDKADKIQRDFDFFMAGNRDEQGFHRTTPGLQFEAAFMRDKNNIAVGPNPELIDLAQKQVRILEIWRKTHKKIPVLVNPQADLFINAQNWKPADISKVKTIDAIRVVDRKAFKMRKTTVIAMTLIDDEYPDLAVQNFDIVPLYAKKKGNRFWGKVEAVKDAQREINKRHSQAVDIMNKVSNYGWFIDGQTFNRPFERDKFKNTSSSPGFMSEIADITRPPVQIDGVKFPNELVNMMALDSQKLRELMIINPELTGESTRAESGVAIAQKNRQALTGNEFLFDNLSLAKRTIGRMLVAMIQKHYTPERIIRILENKAARDSVEVGGEPLFPQAADVAPQLGQEASEEEMALVQQGLIEGRKAQITELLETQDLTRYDVVVGENAWSPTTRQSNFIVWAELAGRGIPVPPDLLVDLSDLPEKDRVKEAIAAQAQAQAEADAADRDTEIQKTLIAAQSKQQGQNTSK